MENPVLEAPEKQLSYLSCVIGEDLEEWHGRGSSLWLYL
jgi:hypothetical protein